MILEKNFSAGRIIVIIVVASRKVPGTGTISHFKTLIVFDFIP